MWGMKNSRRRVESIEYKGYKKEVVTLTAIEHSYFLEEKSFRGSFSYCRKRGKSIFM